jgi:hypothetical protein
MILTKTVALTVDGNSFPNKKTPKFLQSTGSASLDVAQALLMLGTVSVPGGFSTASPARYWAWVRYFSAISPSTDLRIIQEFSDLDPHQKTILSDDFGVAVCTKLLYDRLGGLKDIVDGRKFILQYASLIKKTKKRSKKKPPKIGPNKCPDFVLLDKNGKWHVLECKGTQTNTYYRGKQLNTARSQKSVIEVTGVSRGEQLAAGLFLADDASDERTSVHIVDPEPDPYVVLDSQHATLAIRAQRRLAISRALGFSGFTVLADELSIPPELEDEDLQLLNKEERRRSGIPVADRFNAAIRMLVATKNPTFDDAFGTFTGQRINLDLPSSPFSEHQGVRRVEISVGVDANLIESLREIDPSRPHIVDQVEERSASFLIDEILFDTSDNEVSIHCGSLFAARMRFT